MSDFTTITDSPTKKMLVTAPDSTEGQDLAKAKGTKRAKVFFSNLNGVRAIAALMVVIAHIELHKKDFNLTRIPGIRFYDFGKIGVTVFFCIKWFFNYLSAAGRKRDFFQNKF